VVYTHEGEELTGWIVRDAARTGPRPGILVVHEWWGLGDHARNAAERLARMGYVALAVDMYGTGKYTQDPKQAGEWSGRFRGEGKTLGRARIRAALDLLRADPGVDPTRIGAIGFCFGGTVCLELAWSGADLRGVVSFHGNLTTPSAEEAKGVKASILVCHGADDAFVTPEALASFENACRDGAYDWTLVKYGGAVHSFTNPAADGSFNAGVKYHPLAERRSFEHMRDFFKERFGE
jgi:dienelactone hydrolase